MKNFFENAGFHGNKIQESLTANIAEDSYREVTRVGGLIDTDIIYTSPAKTQKIREVLYTRTGNLVSTVVTKQYSNAGALVRTYTETISRSGGLIASVTGVES